MFSSLRQKLRLWLQDHRWYWRLKHSLENLRFRYARFVVGIGRRISAVRLQSTALRALLLRSSGSVLPSIVFAVLLLLASKLQHLGVDGFISSVLSDIPPESVSAYNGVLAVVLTVTGLFLTLYYTNFNTVIGTLYAEFPATIRELLIDEPQNRTALLALTNFIVFTLVTLGFGTVLGIRSVASLFFIVVGGALVVPIFAFVARRTLFFFDPTHLAHTAIYDLSSASEEVMANRHLSSDAAVQNYRSSLAYAALEKLNALGRIAAENKNYRRDSFCALLMIVFSFLPEYQRRKSYIPTYSKWYRQTFRHKDWYMARFC